MCLWTFTGNICTWYGTLAWQLSSCACEHSLELSAHGMARRPGNFYHVPVKEGSRVEKSGDSRTFTTLSLPRLWEWEFADTAEVHVNPPRHADQACTFDLRYRKNRNGSEKEAYRVKIISGADLKMESIGFLWLDITVKCMCVCVCVCVFVWLFVKEGKKNYQGCSVRFFGSKGSIKFVKVLEPSNCSKGSMCNFWKRALGQLSPSKLPKQLCMLINNYRGKRGAGMRPFHHCRAEKGEP